MNELRDLRRTIGLGQREFAALLSIPLETFRPWNSGRRVVSAAVLRRAREAIAHHQRQYELLPLDQRQGTSRSSATHYRCFSGQQMCPLPLPTLPDNYDEHLRHLRRRMRLTQEALAHRIGAAGKAVVYQWESGKRTPSPVLWQRVLELARRRAPVSI